MTKRRVWLHVIGIGILAVLSACVYRGWRGSAPGAEEKELESRMVAGDVDAAILLSRKCEAAGRADCCASYLCEGALRGRSDALDRLTAAGERGSPRAVEELVRYYREKDDIVGERDWEYRLARIVGRGAAVNFAMRVVFWDKSAPSDEEKMRAGRALWDCAEGGWNYLYPLTKALVEDGLVGLPKGVTIEELRRRSDGVKKEDLKLLGVSLRLSPRLVSRNRERWEEYIRRWPAPLSSLPAG